MLPIIFGVFIVCFILERLSSRLETPQCAYLDNSRARDQFRAIDYRCAGRIYLGEMAVNLFRFSSVCQAGNVAGGCIAYVIATFIFYWWHRWRHTVDFLWTHFHQIHHSPQRLEVITSFYKHPLEMTVNSIIGSLLVYTSTGSNC